MNKCIYPLLFVLFIFNTINAQEFASNFALDPYNPEYEPNEVVIKFKDDVDISVLKSASGSLKTGYSGLDLILKQSKAEELTKIFPHKTRLKSAKLVSINGETKEVPQLFNFYKLKVAGQTDVMDLVIELQNQPEVEIAEPNYYVYSDGDFSNSDFIRNTTEEKQDNTRVTKSQTLEEPNDPLYAEQWYLQAVHAPEAWQTTKGDSTQIIAILDTGVDWLHPDLDDNIWTNTAEINGIDGVDDDGNGFIDDYRGWDFVNNDNDPKDDNSHGTHVAGIAAAEQNNGIGITGVAPEARIMPVKLLQSSGRGNSTDLAAAIDYASENGATVINMSLGSYAESLVVKAALENAYITSVLVAASGNNGWKLELDGFCPTCGNHFPACYTFVFGVQATNFSNGLAVFSNYDATGPIDYNNPWGHNYELRAPGVAIVSSIPNGNYRSYNGTSMAAPIVSGALALHKISNPDDYTEEIIAKQIFSADSNFQVVDIPGHLGLDLSTVGPKLKYISYTLTDSLGDNDGRADAGETIELYFEVKNIAGYADSCWAKIRFGEFEDPTTCEVLDSTNYLGDISTWANQIGDEHIDINPVKIHINPDVAHDRDIVLELEIGAKEWNETILEPLVINVERGIKLAGILTEDDTLSANYLYLVNDSYRVGSDATLYIMPGTEIQIYSGKSIEVRGRVIANGTKDSLIWIHSKGDNMSANGFFFDYGSSTSPLISEFSYCKFNTLTNPIDMGTHNAGEAYYARKTKNCLFEDVEGYIRAGMLCKNNIIRYSSNVLFEFTDSIYYNNIYEGNYSVTFMDGINFNNFSNFYNPDVSYDYSSGNPLVLTAEESQNENNNIISVMVRPIAYLESYDVIKIPNNYWGTTDEEKFKNIGYDFWDDNSLPILDFNPFLNKPSPLTHGLVWKVEINDINPQDEFLEPIGGERIKFDVYFNRPMDIEYPPLIGFGVKDPYLQRIVEEDGAWSEDSTIYTAYYTVDARTGDGLNSIKVLNARDPEGFEIPPEYTRFKFNIQAAGAASLVFQATPGIGKVDLEWPAATTDDALGYNMYRITNLTDSTYSDTFLISNELIIDTLYLDTDVEPGTTYQYLYKIVGTDMQETDFSKAVSATPFNAASGDANGDLSVNVSDIVTVVNYILENDPAPFLFDAADVNYDDAINVLDIVALVNLILNPEGASKAGILGNAQISIEDGIVYVDSPVELGGIQFTLADVSSEQEVETLKALEGFEVVRKMQDGKLTILAYSLSGNTISDGKTALLKLSNTKSWIFEAILSNTTGQSIDWELKGDVTAIETMKLNAGFSLGQNYPNPFTGITTIPFELEMNVEEVSISIFDIIGRTVKQWQLKELNKGSHMVEWESGNNPGVYIYKMQVKQKGKVSYAKTKRMVIQ